MSTSPMRAFATRPTIMAHIRIVTATANSRETHFPSQGSNLRYAPAVLMVISKPPGTRTPKQLCDGCGFRPSNAAVLYEFATNTHGFTGGMNLARVFDSAVRLPNGQVLVSGGTSTISSGATLASAELYTP